MKMKKKLNVKKSHFLWRWQTQKDNDDAVTTIASSKKREKKNLPEMILKIWDPISWVQFHQHFTSSFYARRSQKCKNDSQFKKLFGLSVSVREYILMKLTPGDGQKGQNWETNLFVALKNKSVGDHLNERHEQFITAV